VEECFNVSCGPFGYCDISSNSCQCVVGLVKNGTNCTGKCIVFNLLWEKEVKNYWENTDQQHNTLGITVNYINKSLE
jgi:hypothetical protein